MYILLYIYITIYTYYYMCVYIYIYITIYIWLILHKIHFRNFVLSKTLKRLCRSTFLLLFTCILLLTFSKASD